MGSLKNKTVNGIKWTAIEKISVQGIQFFLGLIMARLLTPEDYGTIGMLAIFIALSQTFIDSGFANALIRKIDRTEEDLCTAFYFNIIIALVCYGALFVVAPWIADFFNTPLLCSILRIQSISLIINSLMGVHVAKLTIDLDFKSLAKTSLYASLISGVFGVILAYCGYGIWALVAQTIFNSVITMLGVWTYCKWIPRKKFNTTSFRNLWNFGSKLLASGILNTIYGNLTPLIIGRYFSAKDLGVYSRGTHLASYPANITNDILGKVTFPILSKIQNDDDHLISAYRKYISVSSIFIFFGCILLCSLARPIVLAVLTAKWEDCIIYLQIYCFSIMFDHICRINLNLLQVKGRSDLFFRLEVIKKTISFAILIASIPFGVIGICISKVIYSQIAVFINTYYTGKLFNLGYVEQLRDFSKYFFIAIIACIPSFCLSYLPINIYLTILVGGAISIFAYYFLLRKNAYMIEISNIVLKRIHKIC